MSCRDRRGLDLSVWCSHTTLVLPNRVVFEEVRVIVELLLDLTHTHIVREKGSK